jgi:ABC-type Fe3+-hydroxamate transport system substrate-binding protein
MFISPQTHKHTAKKIVSLVPSITELLYHFGLEEETIAITKFCTHPSEWFKIKTKVGGTKKANIKLIKSLQPDLIICSKEENVKMQVDELAKDFPVLLTDVSNFEDALKMIIDVGILTNKENESVKLVKEIEEKFAKIKLRSLDDISAAYLIWKEPYMTVGADTYISDMLLRAGIKNIFSNQMRYPTISVEDIQKANPDFVLLSSEPYPFKDRHVAELQSELPNSKVVLVDGEMFSWYGSRMLLAADYFLKFRHQLSSI